jgi:hypothetical protein
VKVMVERLQRYEKQTEETIHLSQELTGSVE